MARFLHSPLKPARVIAVSPIKVASRTVKPFGVTQDQLKASEPNLREWEGEPDDGAGETINQRDFFNSVGQLTTTVIDDAALSPAGGKARMRWPSWSNVIGAGSAANLEQRFGLAKRLMNSGPPEPVPL